VLEGYRRITEAVHAHGTPILAQLNHNGGQASSMYSRLPVWAPSPVADPLFREVPKPVDESAIQPRFGITATVPRLRWTFRAFYGHYYQAPPIETVSGPLLLYQAAADALKKWKYEPSI